MRGWLVTLVVALATAISGLAAGNGLWQSLGWVGIVLSALAGGVVAVLDRQRGDRTGLRGDGDGSAGDAAAGDGEARADPVQPGAGGVRAAAGGRHRAGGVGDAGLGCSAFAS